MESPNWESFFSVCSSFCQFRISFVEVRKTTETVRFWGTLMKAPTLARGRPSVIHGRAIRCRNGNFFQILWCLSSGLFRNWHNKVSISLYQSQHYAGRKSKFPTPSFENFSKRDWVNMLRYYKRKFWYGQHKRMGQANTTRKYVCMPNYRRLQYLPNRRIDLYGSFGVHVKRGTNRERYQRDTTVIAQYPALRWTSWAYGAHPYTHLFVDSQQNIAQIH